MDKALFVRSTVNQLICNYQQGKFSYFMAQMSDSIKSLDNLKMAMLATKNLPDLKTIISGMPSRFDANLDVVNTAIDRVSTIVEMLEIVKHDLCKGLYERHGFVSENPDKYTVDNKEEGVGYNFENYIPRIGDMDYEDHRILVEALNKSVEAKKFMVDPNYDKKNYFREVTENLEIAYDNFMLPLVAYFITSSQAVNEESISGFIRTLNEKKKVPELLKVIRDCIDKNKVKEMEAPEDILVDILSKEEFTEKIIKSITDFQKNMIKEEHPELGNILEQLSKLADKNIERDLTEDESW